MIFLKNDYGLGAHPKVMAALNETNSTYADGYGIDPFSLEAAKTITSMVGCPTADVHFLPGGTLTNLTSIAAFLRPHQAVISPETGHICVHETGAIEACGHKIIHVPSSDGKITPSDIDRVMAFHEDEHYVQPGLLYISNSTETGNTYTLEQLMALRHTCDNHGLLLYMDGARIAMALTAPSNDLSLKDLPHIADAFYLGGTKNGILFGEALVIVNSALKKDFRFLLKQRGGMLAKGRLMGVQFSALLKDNLFLELGNHANQMAAILAKGIKDKGYEFDQEPKTNLLFPIFPRDLVDKLEKQVMFEGWRDFGDKKAIRLVTSWATKEEEILEFLALI